MNNILAIIPARGGSKGVIRKNIEKLNGIPLIQYTIMAALESKKIDRIMVSTDDKEIAEIALKLGAEVPNLRPDYLAQDNSKVIDTCLFVLQEYREMGYEPDIIILLQPTSPLRNSIHIDEAINLFYEKEADSVISVCESPHPPSFLMEVGDNGQLEPYLKNKVIFNNRQNLDKSYILNGAIYITGKSLLENNKSFFSPNKTYSYIMPVKDSIDIDTPFDFKIASMLLKEKNFTKS